MVLEHVWLGDLLIDRVEELAIEEADPLEGGGVCEASARWLVRGLVDGGYADVHA